MAENEERHARICAALEAAARKIAADLLAVEQDQQKQEAIKDRLARYKPYIPKET